MNDFKQKFLAKIENKSNKKTIENLVAFVIILIATIIFINYVWNDDKDNINGEEQINDNNLILAQSTTSVVSNNNVRNKFRNTN